LSQERARTVRDLLVDRKVLPERIQSEGRADTEPLVPNDSLGNRALNRRVEITLMVGRANVPPASAKSASQP
jgi:type VI secretion system protein ImpK